jgi:hypothetical protein
MVNREAGNPDVLDSYLGPDIIAACQPLTFLGPFIVTIQAKYRVNTHSGKSCLAHAMKAGRRRGVQVQVHLFLISAQNWGVGGQRRAATGLPAKRNRHTH